jgi:hypothetical protein
VARRVQCRKSFQKKRRNFMARGGNAPKHITWIICLILYAVAMLAHFGVVHVSSDIAVWSWIIGFGLLLVACRVRGL